MNTVRLLAATITCIFSFTVQAQSVTIKELRMSEGAWAGTYSSADAVSHQHIIKQVTAKVYSTGKDGIIFSYTFADGAQHLRGDTILVTNQGKTLAHAEVVQKNAMEDGALQVIADENITENGQALVLRHIYIIGKNRLQVARQVRYTSSGGWITRDEYLLAK
jgi:hypothetical protein